MKTLTASEARRQWFRLLDEVADGEVVVIERNGKRIMIQRQQSRVPEPGPARYGALLRADNAEQADEWSWEWKGPGKELRPAPRRAR